MPSSRNFVRKILMGTTTTSKNNNNNNATTTTTTNNNRNNNVTNTDTTGPECNTNNNNNDNNDNNNNTSSTRKRRRSPSPVHDVQPPHVMDQSNENNNNNNNVEDVHNNNIWMRFFDGASPVRIAERLRSSKKLSMVEEGMVVEQNSNEQQHATILPSSTVPQYHNHRQQQQQQQDNHHDIQEDPQSEPPPPVTTRQYDTNNNNGSSTTTTTATIRTGPISINNKRTRQRMRNHYQQSYLLRRQQQQQQQQRASVVKGPHQQQQNTSGGDKRHGRLDRRRLDMIRGIEPSIKTTTTTTTLTTDTTTATITASNSNRKSNRTDDDDDGDNDNDMGQRSPIGLPPSSMMLQTTSSPTLSHSMSDPITFLENMLSNTTMIVPTLLLGLCTFDYAINWWKWKQQFQVPLMQIVLSLYKKNNVQHIQEMIHFKKKKYNPLKHRFIEYHQKTIDDAKKKKKAEESLAAATTTTTSTVGREREEQQPLMATLNEPTGGSLSSSETCHNNNYGIITTTGTGGGEINAPHDDVNSSNKIGHPPSLEPVITATVQVPVYTAASSAAHQERQENNIVVPTASVAVAAVAVAAPLPPPSGERLEYREGPPLDDERCDKDVVEARQASHHSPRGQQHEEEDQQQQVPPVPVDCAADRCMPSPPHKEDADDHFLLDGTMTHPNNNSLPTSVRFQPTLDEDDAFCPDSEELSPLSIDFQSPASLPQQSERNPHNNIQIRLPERLPQERCSGVRDGPTRLDTPVQGRGVLLSEDLRLFRGQMSPTSPVEQGTTLQDQHPRPPDPPAITNGDTIINQSTRPVETADVPTSPAPHLLQTMTSMGAAGSGVTRGPTTIRTMDTNQNQGPNHHYGGYHPWNPYLRRPHQQASRNSDNSDTDRTMNTSPNVTGLDGKPVTSEQPAQTQHLPRMGVTERHSVEVGDENHRVWEASADPTTTAESEILLSQYQKENCGTNNNNRRVTLSPYHVIGSNKMIDSDVSGGNVNVAAAAASAASVNNNNKDVGGSSSNDNKVDGPHDFLTTDRPLKGPPPKSAIGWISNEPGRAFVHDKATLHSLKPAAVITDRYRGKENPRPKGSVTDDVGTSVGGKAGPLGASETNDWKQVLPKPTERPDDHSLWSDEGTLHNRHNYKYHEVIRKRAEREGLKPYDCPDCAAFVNMILQGEGAKYYNRNELMCCSRHRSRHTPPSTPPDFWELSFIDERDRKLEEK